MIGKPLKRRFAPLVLAGLMTAAVFAGFLLAAVVAEGSGADETRVALPEGFPLVVPALVFVALWWLVASMLKRARDESGLHLEPKATRTGDLSAKRT